MAIAVCCGLALHQYRLGEGLTRLSYQIPLAARGDIPANGAVIVYMDEKSHQQLGQPLNAPFDRRLHAKLIDRLTQAGARAVVFDIVFSDPDAVDPSRDDVLATAIKANGKVVLAADNILDGPKVRRAIPPIPLFLDAGAAVGSAELVPDADMVVREHTQEEQLPSLSWAAYDLVLPPGAPRERVGIRTHWLNYYGAGNSVPFVSYFEALDPALSPNSFFSNQVVFVGARMLTKFAGQRKDEYSNPLSFHLTTDMAEKQGGLFMAGVEIQATAFLNLLNNQWCKRLPLNAESRCLFLFGLAIGLVLSFRLHPVWSMVIAGLVAAAITAAALWVFNEYRFWFPWLIGITQVAAALTWSVTYNAMRLYVQKRLYEHTLGLYLSPKLVKKFSSTPRMLKPGAEKQMLTLLFSDIADFTSISEGMDSDDLAKMMNEYFQTAVTECIHKTDGTVVKYIGDAIFAFWNAPEPQADHAYRACCAALHFKAKQKATSNGHTLTTRIGLHTGVANVGNFGSEDRVDYTALGENVNLASRMEGLNKFLGTQCLISGTTAAEIGDSLVCRNLGRFQLKGFENPVEVHELVSFLDQAESTRLWRQTFAEALKNYEQRNFSSATAAFQKVLELKPDDGPSRFYLSKLEELSSKTLPENWATFTVLKEK